MSYEFPIFHLCLRRVAAVSAVGLFALCGRAAVVPVSPVGGEVFQLLPEAQRKVLAGKTRAERQRVLKELDARAGKPGDSLQRRIELYLLDCGVTEKEIEAFRSIMLE